MNINTNYDSLVNEYTDDTFNRRSLPIDVDTVTGSEPDPKKKKKIFSADGTRITNETIFFSETTGYSVGEITDFLLEGADIWASKFLTHHTANLKGLEGILKDQKIGGRTGDATVDREETHFSVHPYWTHHADSGSTISFKRQSIESKYKLYKPTYVLGASRNRGQGDADTAMAFNLAWKGNPRVLARPKKPVPVSAPERLNNLFGPWEGELRAASSVKFDKSNISHVTHHLHSNPNEDDWSELAKAKDITAKHGVKFVVSITPSKAGGRMWEQSIASRIRKEHGNVPIITSNQDVDMEKSDIAKHYKSAEVYKDL